MFVHRYTQLSIRNGTKSNVENKHEYYEWTTTGAQMPVNQANIEKNLQTNPSSAPTPPSRPTRAFAHSVATLGIFYNLATCAAIKNKAKAEATLENK